MDGVVSWYMLDLHHLFNFIACISLLPTFFLSFFVSSITCQGIEVSLAIFKMQSGFVSRFLSGVSGGKLLQFHLVINVTGFVEPTEPGSV